MAMVRLRFAEPAEQVGIDARLLRVLAGKAIQVRVVVMSESNEFGNRH